jgi:hypothetical protein
MEAKHLTQINQTVGLASDAEFRGIVWGESAPADPVKGPVMLVLTKVPGATGKHGCTLIALADLVVVKAVMR